jgi:hypothetical protein
MWHPISLDDLQDLIRSDEALMDEAMRSVWDLVRVDPVKWQQHPCGDDGGGFWVVGLMGRHVVWYNDLEHGFNVSRYTAPGVIDEYWCNQDPLRAALNRLLDQPNHP